MCGDSRVRECAAPPASPRIHSSRGKLTLANVGLLALGIIVATAVSLMGMRHYLLDQVDTELSKTRESLTGSRLTLHQIDSLTALAFVRERMVPRGPVRQADSIFAAVDGHGTPLDVGGFKPTDIQRALVAADDPGALAHDPAPHDTTVHGASYRVTGARLADGTYVLLAASTDALHKGIAKALKLDLGVGTLLLSLLAVLTMISVSRRMRPLEDMVETSSAIAWRETSPGACPPATIRPRRSSSCGSPSTPCFTRAESAYLHRRAQRDAAAPVRRGRLARSRPLSAIRGYLQLYEKGMLREPGERRRAWDRMNARPTAWGASWDELLILARLDQSPELRFKNVDLSRLVRDAAEDLRAQQPGRPVTVGADGTLLVHADESGLRQVLGTCGQRTHPHAPADVPVRLGLEREDGTVRLCVADQGPGAGGGGRGAHLRPVLPAGGGAGSGLGMAIVQGVVAAHGGDVAVRTAPGAGLEVTVTLPTRWSSL